MFDQLLSLFTANELLMRSLHVLLKLWPLWLSAVALRVAIHQWLLYKQREWIATQGSVLLEIRLPTEQFKSPASMELAIQALHQAGVGSLTDVYLKGRVRRWTSLELVSDGGQVHFYIWCFKSERKGIETALYAQFPNIEIHEAPDYALPIRYDTQKYKFGKVSHLVLTKADAYPIKTYIDYGLEKDPKEEYKTDPLSNVIEFLGSLKPGEHAWIQILLRAHAKETLKYGRIFTKPDWKSEAEKEIKEILKKAKLQSAAAPDKYDPKYLTEVQKITVNAIERSLEKPAFDSMIRVAYFAEEAAFNAANIGGILGVLKQFSSQTWNGFKPSWYDFDYPWQDIDSHIGTLWDKKSRVESEFLEAYKRRSHFYEPFKWLHDDKPYILTTEEVATLFHFPSAMVAATPTLARIPSKKAEAPANLPI
jgi:hypothetical protein